MTADTRRKKPTDLDAKAPQADGYSWSESQTGISSHHEDERGDLDESGGDVSATVTMLDYEGTPVVTVTKTPESQNRATRPEI